MRLITNDPAKYGGLHGDGLDVVGHGALPVVETAHNVRYLRPKRGRMHHELVLADDALSDARGVIPFRGPAVGP